VDILRYLEWLPSDHPLPTAEPLGELLFRLAQLMREVEHLHGMLGQEPAPWLLLCRDSDLLNADTELPTGYDKVYADLMQTYRNAARTAMSVADTAGRVASPHPQAVALSWRIALQLESALWIYRGLNPDPRLLVEIMAREFECLTRRFDVIHLHSKEKAAECRMANMLVWQTCSGATSYELPISARWLIVAYSDIATPPQTTEPPGAQHARWYLRREVQRGGNAAFHMRGMQRSLAARALSPAHPPCDGSGAAGVGGVVDQKTRDTGYTTMTMNFARTKEPMERLEHGERAPLDRTEPRLEAELGEADNAISWDLSHIFYWALPPWRPRRPPGPPWGHPMPRQQAPGQAAED
jgi:hypothetical protein